MDEKKTVQSLDQLFAAGDAWLRKYGMVTGIAHNAIVMNLYVAFPKVKYLEYFLPESTENRKVWVILYVPLWRLLFMNRDKMVEDVIFFLREYLDSYDIRVELKRYKKGVEKHDQIPKNATEHFADINIRDDSVSVPTEDKPSANPTSTEPAAETIADGGQDSSGTSDSGSKPGPR